jgi:PadR family transcriptional regulator PadR
MATTAAGLELYRRELLKGTTETLILSMLAEDVKYGYQLVKEMDSRSNGYFHLKEGTLYPALHRMERDGYVESMWMDSPNHQSRRYYLVTPADLDRLRSMVLEWDAFCEAFNVIASPIRSMKGNRNGNGSAAS